MEDAVEKKMSPFKHMLNTGLILGVVAILFTVVAYLTGDIYKQNNWENWGSLLVSFVLVYYFTVKYRKEECENYLSYGQAFKFGWISMMISAVISLVFMMILQNVIEPDFMSKMMDVQREAMAEKGMSDAQIEAAIAFGKKFQSPAIVIIVGLVWSMIISLVISLITAIFAKRNRPVFE